MILSSRYQAVTLSIFFILSCTCGGQKKKSTAAITPNPGPQEPFGNAKADGALCTQTKSTEPPKRLPKGILAVRVGTSEISVFFIFLAVISQPVIYYFCLSDSQ
jgi:hypothetical protein